MGQRARQRFVLAVLTSVCLAALMAPASGQQGGEPPWRDLEEATRQLRELEDQVEEAKRFQRQADTGRLSLLVLAGDLLRVAGVAAAACGADLRDVAGLGAGAAAPLRLFAADAAGVDCRGAGGGSRSASCRVCPA